MGYYSKSPTEKQIAFADAIAEYLNIDFPRSSRDFTRAKYSKFISEYAQEYYHQIYLNDPSTGDDEMDWFRMIN